MKKIILALIMIMLIIFPAFAGVPVGQENYNNCSVKCDKEYIEFVYNNQKVPKATALSFYVYDVLQLNNMGFNYKSGSNKFSSVTVDFYTSESGFKYPVGSQITLTEGSTGKIFNAYAAKITMNGSPTRDIFVSGNVVITN